MEYYFGDALRWSYGFDNPNKAAVLFACALPLAWILWALAWRPKSLGIRIPAVLLSGALILTVAFLLFKTYSRGGAVAAAGGILYAAARAMGPASPRRRWFLVVRDVVLGMLVAGVFVETGLGDRTRESVEGGDASVGNRLVLWRAALQMAAENPGGFGVGKSGEAYMNWYQPVGMTEGYRTMVNSYLTALVEWGWLPFAAVLLLAAFFWGWANPGKPSSRGYDVASGLRGAVLAFGVAGIFSTTMEEGTLWILPGLALLGLVVWSGLERRPFRTAGPSMGMAAGICVALAAAGWFWSGRDNERREFSFFGEKKGDLKIGGRDPAAEEWTVIPDNEVLGTSGGKLLRPMARALKLRMDVRSEAPTKAENLMLAGRAVRDARPEAVRRLVLLAPETVALPQAEALLAAAQETLIFVPDIDEDGRAEFWGGLGSGRKGIEVVTVEGVGRQLDWGWDQVIEALRRR